MCGIFGAIGQYDKDKLKILAIMNEERGKDSFGLYRKPFTKKTGIIYRIVDKPTNILSESKVNKYLKAESGIFMGHTRFATRGSKHEVKNAHPFIFGNIIGTHNGIIYNINEIEKDHNLSFSVDSEAIFHFLNEKSSYRQAFSELRGYWGLAWIDKREPNCLFLTKHGNTLYYAKIDNKAIYYSSDIDHLKLIMGGRHDGDIKEVLENQPIRIDSDLNIKRRKKYKPKVYTYVAPVYKPTWRTKKHNYNATTNAISKWKEPVKYEDNYFGDSIPVEYDCLEIDKCDYCAVDISETPKKKFFHYEGQKLCSECAKYMIEEFHLMVYSESGHRIYPKDL